jgi:hypothetical protein
MTADAFRRVLKREPEESALDAFSGALLSEALTPHELVLNLIESEEFGTRAQYHPTVAHHLARTVITTLMARDPGPEAISAYANSIANGYTLESFLNEMIGSGEFLGRIGAVQTVTSSPVISYELGQLIEQLIVSHLVNEDLHIATPPRELKRRPPVSEGRMRTMIHTLAMLADLARDSVPGRAPTAGGGDHLVGTASPSARA